MNFDTKKYNKEYSKKYYELNKERILKRTRKARKEYYYKNIEKEKLRKSEYYHKNRKKINKYHSEYIKDNRAKINEKVRERLKNDINYKISQNLRCRLSTLFKNEGIRKTNKFITLLGCSKPELKSYLELKFLPTITWDNYGKYWHIDHIIPCALFDLTKEEEQKKCFHYTNLQPLFAVDIVINGVFYKGNINKGDKIEIMIKNVNPEKLIKLVKKGYSYDYIYILLCVKAGIPLDHLKSTEKTSAMIKTIERKGLLTSDGKITLEGQNLIDFSESEEENPILVKKKSEVDEIAMFWKVFPATDTFEHKGKKFAGSRALRINKEGCRIKLKAILNTGEYTLDEILAAIEYDVLSKKEASIKEGTNKLKYMQNSLTYLNQLSFEPYIELIKQGNKIKTATIGGTDI